MDINSYEALIVIETMREYGAPLSALSAATGLPENKLKNHCQREDIGICWIEVYLSILQREDTGRKFSMESLLEKEQMQFCHRRKDGQSIIVILNNLSIVFLIFSWL